MAQWPTDPDYTPLTQINKGNEFDAGDGLIADDVNKIVKNAVAYVKANPTDDSTTDLTKLKVGDTTYNIPQGGAVDAYTKAETNALLDTKANVSDIPTVSTLGKTGQLKDGTQDTTHRLVTDTEKSTWNGKQAQLTTAQLNAVNSGITASKVSTYDGYAATINNKVDKVTGKGLSTNDFTTAEKTKLAGIETGAEVNEIDTITAGENVTVSKSGKTVTISATGGGGTTVVANPTLTGSEANLTALQVGDTKYGIKALKVTVW